MSALKNVIVQGFLATAVVAMPLASEGSSSVDVGSQDATNAVWSPALVARKNADKCEAHIAIDCKFLTTLSIFSSLESVASTNTLS